MRQEDKGDVVPKSTRSDDSTRQYAWQHVAQDVNCLTIIFCELHRLVTYDMSEAGISPHSACGSIIPLEDTLSAYMVSPVGIGFSCTATIIRKRDESTA